MSDPVVHRKVALLRVAEPRVLEEVRLLLPLDDFAIAVVSDTEIAIDPSRLGELASLLSERGFAPLMKRATAEGGESTDDESTHTTRRRAERYSSR